MLKPQSHEKLRPYFLKPKKIFWFRNPRYFYFKRQSSDVNENELSCLLIRPEALTEIYTGSVQS
jgi:hypothetical protein